jgi:hypothetical protein
MKFQEFSYEVRAEIVLDACEVAYLRSLAAHHYDAKCRAAAESGGFLFGWMNTVGDESGPVKATFRQLDLCCKILEGGPADVPLASEIPAALRMVALEQQRCNDARAFGSGGKGA